jgi:DNA replication protein DnaC
LRFLALIAFYESGRINSDWENIFHNTTIATAIADRLIENSEIILLGGESLRKTNRGPTPTE